jgi:glycosyltransferase involved in cell wall biosynthesis
MKVLFLTLSRIDSLEKRGIYHDLLRQFKLNNFEVVVVCPVERRTGKTTKLLFSNDIRILQVKTFNIQKTAIWEKVLGTLTINYFFKSAIKKHLNDKNFDLILYSTPPITLSKLILWLKVKYSSYTYLLLKDIFPQNAIDLKMIKKNSLIHKYFLKHEKNLYENSDMIGCMSPANQKYMQYHFPNLIGKIEINPNSIEILEKKEDENLRIKLFKKYSIPNDSILFIYGGNLGKPQGPFFLTEIINKSYTLTPNAFFLIIGSGTEYKNLKKWFNKNKPSNAILIGELPEKEYNQIVLSSDVGLILLKSDFTIPNFPSRLLSYLENKKPVLSITDDVSDVGLISENEGFGKWAKYGDIENVLEKILFFVENDEIRSKMGQTGFGFLLKNYDVKITYNKIVNSLKKNNSKI